MHEFVEPSPNSLDTVAVGAANNLISYQHSRMKDFSISIRPWDCARITYTPSPHENQSRIVFVYSPGQYDLVAELI
jgi:hypothetical protein